MKESGTWRDLTDSGRLYLGGSPVSDLAPLAGLTRLEVLDLSQTGAVDLGPLAGLTGLRVLYLGRDKERFAAEELATLRQSLPACQIVFAPPPDDPLRLYSLEQMEQGLGKP